MKSVCVVTSTRADFGLFSPLLKQLYQDPQLDVHLVATGAHLSTAQGMTVSEIEQGGFPIAARIPILETGDDAVSESRTMANALCGFADYFTRFRPDMLIVLGDRYEIEAICCAAVNACIPIAHLCGGETTEGAIDECYRHAITKMSYLHFTSCEAYRRRVIRLGEAPDRVYNVGSLSIDNFAHDPGSTMAELEAFVKMTLRRYAVVTFHPVTLEQDAVKRQLHALIAAMRAFPDMQYVITKANADAGGETVNRIWAEAVRQEPLWRLTPSLGMHRYVTALRRACCMIGNSSSGIMEAPAAGIPTVNIGDRQKGRIQADSIINCAPDRDAIASAIALALSRAAAASDNHSDSPFGDGHAAERIAGCITQRLGKDIDLKKSFYDGTEN